MPAKKTEEEKAKYVAPPKSYYHWFILYKDDPKCSWMFDHFERYPNIYKIAWIYHDKDLWDDEDERKDPEHKSGTPKKPHYHVLVKEPNRRSAESFAQHFGLGYCENVFEPYDAMVYFLHDDWSSRHKHPYLVDDVKGHPDFLKLLQYKNLHFVQLSELCNLTTTMNIFELTDWVKDHSDYEEVFTKYSAWIRQCYTEVRAQKDSVAKQLVELNANLYTLFYGKLN